MSVQAITWALAQTTGSPGSKAVLICLSNYADGEGRCFPGQRRLAENTEMGERTVRRHLADLEAAGLIGRTHRYRDDGSRTSDEYQLAFNRTASEATTGQIGRKAEATTGQIKHDYRPDWPGKEPSGEPSVTTVVSACAREDADLLESKLIEAGGKALNRTTPSLAVLTRPLAWLAGGCDLESDILPTIERLALARPPNSVTSWKYFEQAVMDARATRVAPLPEGNPNGSRPRDGPPVLASMDEMREQFLAEAHEKYG